MKVSDFNYFLPRQLIAQYPAPERDQSKLMVLKRERDTISHKIFADIISFLQAGDCIILNNSKVFPARLFMTKNSGARLEIFLLKKKQENIWEVLVKPGRKAQPGTILTCGNNGFKAEIIDKKDDGRRLMHINYNDHDFMKLIDLTGHIPLPPYIRREDKEIDRARYQTVFAQPPGSIAAPTAGLHFTEELLEKIKQKGVNIGVVTLHVGLGTFKPVTSELVEDHSMDDEVYLISQEVLNLIKSTKKNGKHVWAVGTTTARVLETIAEKNRWQAHKGSTSKFIYPPYEFKIVDSLITNFHLPQSTLLMLVSALAGKDYVLRAYKEAINRQYRFYSYGDAMLII